MLQASMLGGVQEREGGPLQAPMLGVVQEEEEGRCTPSRLGFPLMDEHKQAQAPSVLTR